MQESSATRIFCLEPFIPDDMEILILGSMPSEKSLEEGFYYMHPRNRMWESLMGFVEIKADGTVLSRLPYLCSTVAKAQGTATGTATGADGFEVVPDENTIIYFNEHRSIELYKAMARALKLGFFDVIKSCERKGSLDSNIKKVEPNDIQQIIDSRPTVKLIVCVGNTSATLFSRYNKDLKFKAGKPVPFYKMPSTSPANAKCSVGKLRSYLLDIFIKARDMS